MQYDAMLELKSMEYLGNGKVIAYGFIYADKAGRFKDGSSIHTSVVMVYDYEKAIIKTMNTTYKLIGSYLF